MDNKERIERLRIEARFQRMQFGRDLLASELLEAADTIETLEAQLTELQAKYDKLNDFEQSQCVALLTKKDKQLAAADEFIKYVHSEFAGYMPTAYFERLEELRGPQEAGKEATHE